MVMKFKQVANTNGGTYLEPITESEIPPTLNFDQIGIYTRSDGIFFVFRSEDEMETYRHLFPQAQIVCYNGYCNALQFPPKTEKD